MPRKPRTLSQPLSHQLNLYALSAATAGVGVLSLSRPAEAKIIYTKAHLNCSDTCSLKMDGRVTFNINLLTAHTGTGTSHSRGSGALSVYEHSSEGIKGAVVRSNGSAAALKAGIRVATATAPGGNMWSIKRIGGTGTAFRGNWANNGKGVKDRYLGLKFYVKGKAHFGWARLTTAHDKGPWLRTTLTGYAYETVPNRAIITGKTKGPDVVTVEAGSLGHLARGTSGLKQVATPVR